MPVITFAGENLIAQQQQAGQTLVIDQMILANINGLDHNLVPDRSEAMPSVGDIQITQPITKDGLINSNTVVYSAVFTSTQGTFDFNWMGLYSSEHDVLVAVAYIPVQSKMATVGAAIGNVITKNFAIEFNGAADVAGINISAESWQVDYTARNLSMDKIQRNMAKNIYGESTFLNDGFIIKYANSNYYLTIGQAVLGGLHDELNQDFKITPGALPQTVWLDVYQETSMSGVVNKFDVVFNDGITINDYTDLAVEHSLVRIGTINSTANIVDERDTVVKSFNTPKEIKTVDDKFDHYALKSYVDLVAALSTNLSVGQAVKVMETLSAYKVVAPGSGTTGTGLYHDMGNGNQLELVRGRFDHSYTVLSELRNASGLEALQDGDVVSTGGHTISGVGALHYVYHANDTTSVDNNGTLIVINGMRFWAKVSGYITPQMFGAIANNVTDCTPAITACSLACNGYMFMPAGKYYMETGSVHLDTLTSIHIVGVGGGLAGGTCIRMNDSLSGTAFRVNLVHSLEFFRAENLHIYCENYNDNGTVQQGLQSKNVDVTEFVNITCDQLSQFAIIVGHYETGAKIAYESVLLDNCHVTNHGKASVSTQVGIEFIARNELNSGQAPHPYVIHKTVNNCSVHMRDGVGGAIMKLGTARITRVRDLRLSATDRGGSSAALEMGGSVIVPDATIVIEGLDLVDAGFPAQHAVSCGHIINMTISDSKVETVRAAMVLKSEIDAPQARTLTLNNCDFGDQGILSSYAGGNDNGRKIIVSDSKMAYITNAAGTGLTGWDSVRVRNSDIGRIDITQSFNLLSIEDDSVVGLVALYPNTDATNTVGTIRITNSQVVDIVAESTGTTWESLEVVNAHLADALSVRLSNDCRPNKFILRDTELSRTTAEHHFHAGEVIEFDRVSLINGDATTDTVSLFCNAPLVKINNCQMEDMLVTTAIIYNQVSGGEVRVRNSSLSTVDRAITTIVDTVDAGNVHWRGCVIQDAWVSSLDE